MLRARSGAQRGALHRSGGRRDATTALRRGAGVHLRRRRVDRPDPRAPAAHGRADPRIRVFDNPSRTVSSGLNVCLSHARGRWAVRMDAHTIYPDDYVALGVNRLIEGGTRWVSGPQIPTGHGPVSRAVALALGDSLGRGGSRKWGMDGERDGAEFELDTGVFAGVWERATLCNTAAGTSAGRATRTRRWRRASWPTASASSACPRWGRGTSPGIPCAVFGDSTWTTASSAREPRAAIPARCAPRTCSPRRSSSPQRPRSPAHDRSGAGHDSARRSISRR